MQCQKNTHFCSIICANFWVKNIWANFCEIICENFWVWKKLWNFFRKYLRKFLGWKKFVQIFAQLFAKKFGPTNLCASIFANICAIFWKKSICAIICGKICKKISANFLWILPHVSIQLQQRSCLSSKAQPQLDQTTALVVLDLYRFSATIRFAAMSTFKFISWPFSN